MDKIFGELLKASSSCISILGENTQLQKKNEEYVIALVKNDTEGAKKLRMMSTKEFEQKGGEIYTASKLLNEMNINGVTNKIEEALMNGKKIYSLLNGQKMEISNKLVIMYPESLLNVNLIDTDSRNNKNEIEIDFRLKYVDEMVKYMNNDYDIGELNEMEFDEFCRELMEMHILFKNDIMNRLYNNYTELGNRWKNRCLIVNTYECKLIFDYFKLKLSQLNGYDRIEYAVNNQYEPIIQAFSNYLQDKANIDQYLSRIDRKLINSFFDEYSLDMASKDVQTFVYPIYSPFLKESIINEQQYDSYLKEWAGDYNWKLLYRASVHNYAASSFHEYCDDKGPTLIKSTEGWIFGGYTTQS